jgi:hypothetical protein
MKRLLLLLVFLLLIVVLLRWVWQRLSGRERRKPQDQDTQAGTSPSVLPLFVLPLPAAAAALVALMSGALGMLLDNLMGYGLMLAGALLVRLRLAERAATPAALSWRRLPVKTTGGLLLALGSGITAWLGAGHPPGIGLVFALLTLLGVSLTYGVDRPVWRRPPSLGARGTTSLHEATRAIDAIAQAGREMRQPELSARLATIVALARQILERVEDDPRDLWRARKFLAVYLQGVQRIVEGYAKTHGRVAAPALEQRFRQALETVETAFREQYQVLLERDVEDLDVQIEVLTQQLAREGLL